MPEKAEIKNKWEAVELGSLCREIVGGGTPSTKIQNYWNGQNPWITSKWLGKNLYLKNGEKMISDEAIKNSATHIVPENSLIFATRVGVGKVGINKIPMVINQDLAGLVISNEADPLFVAYQLKTDRVQQYVVSLKRGATIQGITREDLKQIIIHKPALNEQKAIAGMLMTIQKAITGQEELIDKLKELKRSMMQFLFAHGTKGEKTKITEIGEIPESWELVGLASVAKIERGKFDHRPRNAPQFYGGNYPFIQTGDITKSNGHIKKYSQTLNDAGLAISKNFPVGTIFITIAANIGYTAISEIEMACPDSLVGISPYLHTINVEFLNYYLTTQQSIMDAMAPRGTQKNINIEFLKPWKIILPSIKEQEKIAGLLLSIDKKIESAQNKLSVYQSLFKTLLHELMSGERKVKI